MSENVTVQPARPKSIDRVLTERALAAVFTPNRPPTILPRNGRPELFRIASELIGPDAPVTYLEFGVHEGRSIRRIARLFRNPEARFVGFDSFEGLPETWTPGLRKGHFSTQGALPESNDPRISFVKGWFQNTLPGFLTSHPLSRQPVLINFDADLYSSTLFLLTTLWHQIEQIYFFFDEFFPDEVTAFHDFVRSYPVEYELIGCTVDDQDRPLRVFGKMKRTELRLD